MTALPTQTGPTRAQAVPTGTTPNPTTSPGPTKTQTPSHRVAELARALGRLRPGTDPTVAAQDLLVVIDAADAAAGIARVDTNDVELQRQIARIVAGTGLPSRGPGTRARDILRTLLSEDG